MRVRLLIAAIALVCSSGCTVGWLRRGTVNQARSLPELQYQQVLDNLAMFAENPAALPFHVNLREGTTQVTDSLSGGALVDLGPPAITEPQLFGSRTVVAQWGVSPVIDRTELRLIRIAYRRAHGSAEMPEREFLDELAHELKSQIPSDADQRDESELFYEYLSRASKSYPELDARVASTNDDAVVGASAASAELSPLAKNVRRQVDGIVRDLARVHPGWFHVGRRRDVPRDACYVGHYRDRYVWVCPDGREDLTEFTLTMLRFSSLIRETQTLLSPGSVKFSPGDRGG